MKKQSKSRKFEQLIDSGTEQTDKLLENYIKRDSSQQNQNQIKATVQEEAEK